MNPFGQHPRYATIISSRDLGGTDNPTGRFDVAFHVLRTALLEGQATFEQLKASGRGKLPRSVVTLELTVRRATSVTELVPVFQAFMGLATPSPQLLEGLYSLARTVLREQATRLQTEIATLQAHLDAIEKT